MTVFLLYLGLILLSLTILVTIHELGHFFAAKMFGMKVDTFSLFFPPKIVGVKYGETTYQIGMIPLGGYVKIAGIIDESMDKNHLKSEPKPWEYRSKPVWQRMIVMVGGIVMNVILGCLIFIFVKAAYGDMVIPKEYVQYGIDVAPGGHADRLGFEEGDQILTLNGDSIRHFSDVMDPSILISAERMEVLRGGQVVEVNIPDNYLKEFIRLKDSLGTELFMPRTESVILVADSTPADLAGIQSKDRIVMIDSQEVRFFSDIRKITQFQPNTSFEVIIERQDTLENGDVHEVRKNVTLTSNENGLIGVGPYLMPLFKRVDYSFGEALIEGPKQAFSELGKSAKSLYILVMGKLDPSKSVSGPIAIAKSMGDNFVAGGGWESFWRLTGMLSMVLALMNFLPIPALDGGHLMFLTVEAITGKEPSDKIKIIGQWIGMIILAALMIFIFLNDIIKVIG